MTRTGGAFLYQLEVTLRLHFRNRMALLYGYVFPTIFLVVFWVLYRHEPEPLIRHLGELLTVTALGGACFGLPTSMVSERERGVWRRFRLTPARTGRLVATAAVARYVLLLLAALLQVALAMAVFGMPAPLHPLDLLVAFTLVAFAFIGLGLVIAMVADNVPAVQALGQCIFLPMLVIGGVAVRIESLPVWAQHLSAYFPGRYAVAALQVSATGEGLSGAGFAVLALVLIGAAGFVAGAKLFRWDQQQRFVRLEGRQWVAASLSAWVLVGVLAQATGQVAIGLPSSVERETMITLLDTQPLPEEREAADAADRSLPAPTAPAPDTSGSGPPEAMRASADSATGTPPQGAVPAPDPSPAPAALASPETPAPAATGGADAGVDGRRPSEDLNDTDPEPWRAVDSEQLQAVNYAALPPDRGVVAPVASLSEEIYPETLEQLECVRSELPYWGPGRVADPVQRTRNYLYIAAAVDLAQMAHLERWMPLAVYDQLVLTIPGDDLPKVLYWVAAHPEDGDVSAAGQLEAVCIDLPAPGNPYALRARAQVYALKLLGRLIGAIPSE